MSDDAHRRIREILTAPEPTDFEDRRRLPLAARVPIPGHSDLTPRQEATAYRLAAATSLTGGTVLAGVFHDSTLLVVILLVVTALLFHGFQAVADLVGRGGRIL